MAQVFENSMVAHVWAQHSQESGRSSNGNFYFTGRNLFSYGSHYVAAYLAPEPGNLAGVGVVFINSDSYSTSTSRHVSYAATATHGRTRLWLPNVGELAGIFDSAYLESRTRLNPGCYPSEYGEPDARAFAAYCKKRLAIHFAKPCNVPNDGRNVRAEFTARDAAAVVTQVFAAAGCDNPERRARAAVAKAGAVSARAEADAAKRKRADALHALARFANTKPADVAAKMESDAAERGRQRGQWERGRDSWADISRDIFRACKVGTAAGQVARVRKASAVRAAIRANLGLFELAATRNARASLWRKAVVTFRDGFRVAEAFAAGSEARVRVAASGTRHGSAYDVGAAMAAGRELVEYLQGNAETGAAAWAARPARVAGQNATRLAVAIHEKAAELVRVESAMERAERFAARRTELETVKTGVRISPDAHAGARAEALQGVVRIAGRYAERANGRPWYTMPGAWRAAGWNPGKFAELEKAAKAAESAIRAELKTMAENEKAAAMAEALRIWRDGGRVPAELAKYTPRTLPDGSAYIRATGIERDAGGHIVGGTLETSQGATVPLNHAIRVFAFLKACRDAGKAWHKNGRTLRVGHFAVDSVQPDGGFRAGCHKFAWHEVETVARLLSLENIAPADTTESHAHA